MFFMFASTTLWTALGKRVVFRLWNSQFGRIKKIFGKGSLFRLSVLLLCWPALWSTKLACWTVYHNRPLSGPVLPFLHLLYSKNPPNATCVPQILMAKRLNVEFRPQRPKLGRVKQIFINDSSITLYFVVRFVVRGLPASGSSFFACQGPVPLLAP